MTIHYDRSGVMAIIKLQWTCKYYTLSDQEMAKGKMGLTSKYSHEIHLKGMQSISLFEKYMRVGRGLPRNITHPNGQRLSMTPISLTFCTHITIITTNKTRQNDTGKIIDIFRFLSKSFLGFLTFNVITYSILLAELLLLWIEHEVKKDE